MATTTTTKTTTTTAPKKVVVVVNGQKKEVDAATAASLTKGVAVKNAVAADGTKLGTVTTQMIAREAVPEVTIPTAAQPAQKPRPPEGSPVDLAQKPVQVGKDTMMPAEAMTTGAEQAAQGDQLGIDPGQLGQRTPGGMPRDTADVLSSGLLTPDQLEKAKLDNIQKLFKCPGCTDAQRTEMALYLQRFVLDGYIRGVDVPGMIQHGDDEPITFHFQDGRLSGVADTGGGSDVTFRAWDKYDDGWRFQLFYHELGHNLLERGHNANSDSLMYSASGGPGTLQNPSKIRSERYDYMMGELFNPDNWKKTSAGGNKAPSADQLKGYPTVTGDQIKTPEGVPVPQGGPSPGNWRNTGGGHGGGGGGSRPVYNAPPTTNPYWTGPSVAMGSGIGGGAASQLQLPDILKMGQSMSLPQMLASLMPNGQLPAAGSSEFASLLKMLQQSGQGNPMLQELAGFLAKEKAKEVKREAPVKASSKKTS